MGLGIQPGIARAIYPLSCFAARRLASHELLVLTYHRVGSASEIGVDASALAECTTEVFASHLRWLHEHTTPIDVATAVAILDGRRQPPPRPVLVTFDDGYRDDSYRVRAICERFEIRPVIFLPTGFVGTRRRFWWDRVALCLKLTEKPSFLAPLDPEQRLPLGSREEREAATELLLPVAEHLAPAPRDELIAELERRLGVPDTSESEQPTVLDWEDVRALRDSFDFGAHTVTHPMLSHLDREELRREIGESKQALEQHLGEPCQAFAIPYGGPNDYTPEAVQIADELGLRVVFSLEDALRRPTSTGNCWLVDRLTMNEVKDAAGLAAKVTWPKLFVPKWAQRVRARLAAFSL